MADRETLRRAREDLGEFATMVGRPLTAWQVEALRLRTRTTVVRAPRQTGKSRALALLAVHGAFRNPDCRVLIVSAGETGARRLLGDVRAIIAGSPGLSVSVVDENAGFVRLTNGSETRCVPASEAQIRGWSVDLLLVDEAALVDDDLLHGAAIPTTAARPNARVVLMSSARGASGGFYEAFVRGFAGTDPHTMAFSWWIRDAYWITPDALGAMRESIPPALARAELDNEWLDVGDGLRLIEDEHIDDAVARELPGLGPDRLRDLPGGGPLRLGVDVARSGGDETVGVQVRGGRVRVAFHGIGWDLMATADRVVQAVTADVLADPAAMAIVDATGLGAGVVDRARQLGAPVQGFVSASRARQPERHANARAEAYVRLADALRGGLLDIDPADRVLVAQLRQIRWRTDQRGRVLVESKDSLRGRGVSSPDRVDALTMALSLDAAWQPAEILTDEERERREREELLAIYDRAMSVERARERWGHPASWDGSSVMGPVLEERW